MRYNEDDLHSVLSSKQLFRQGSWKYSQLHNQVTKEIRHVPHCDTDDGGIVVVNVPSLGSISLDSLHLHLQYTLIG
jgi:hypothetical protein